jgi:hypothetical protein
MLTALRLVSETFLRVAELTDPGYWLIWSDIDEGAACALLREQPLR